MARTLRQDSNDSRVACSITRARLSDARENHCYVLTHLREKRERKKREEKQTGKEFAVFTHNANAIYANVAYRACHLWVHQQQQIRNTV